MSEPRPDQTPFHYETALLSFRPYGFTKAEAETILGDGPLEDQERRHRTFREIHEALTPAAGADSIRLMFFGKVESQVFETSYRWDKEEEAYRHQETGETVPADRITDHFPTMFERWQEADGPEMVKEYMLRMVGLGETNVSEPRPQKTFMEEIDELIAEG